MATIENIPGGASAAGKGGPQQSSLPPLLVNARRLLRRFLLSEYFILYISIIYFVVLATQIPALATPRNLSNVLANAWPLLTVAVGQTFVLLIAGIDLSQTSVMALASTVGAVFMTGSLDPTLFENGPLWGSFLTENGGLLANSPAATFFGVMAMLLVGILIGAFNGVAVAKFKMPPFMVTLVTMIFVSALAIYLVQSRNIRNLPESFEMLGNGDIISVYIGEKVPDLTRRDIHSLITYPLLIAVGLAASAHFILSRTIIGRHIYAIGTNLRAARISGVPADRIVILVYTFSGFCAAAAAVLYSARLKAGRPTLGDGLLLDIVGATVIGGTSLFGGKGKVLWTFFGVIFFVLLGNTLNLLNLSAFDIDMVKGSIILLAALADVTRTRLLQRE
jgi:ribose/xylose/arabinose/galactoside ABC-type transport system permease subunit